MGVEFLLSSTFAWLAVGICLLGHDVSFQAPELGHNPRVGCHSGDDGSTDLRDPARAFKVRA